MGVIESKITDISCLEELSHGDIPSTPILTSRRENENQNLAYLDPRSPSSNIARTPIQVYIARNDNRETENTLAKRYLLEDPRSPSSQFSRTPLLIPDSKSELPDKLKNKHLDHILNPESTPTKSNESSDMKNILPRLLETSPKSIIDIKVANANKRKSCVGLLETNIDYTETDLDNVNNTKLFNTRLCINVDEPSLTPKNKHLVTVVECENLDPRSPTTEFLRTPIQITKIIGEIDLNTHKNDVLPEALPEPKITDKSINLLKIVDDVKDDNCDNDKEIKDEEKLNVSIHEEHLKKNPVIDLTADVKDFDKKLTNLIYEDKECVVKNRLPRVSRSQLKNRSRTPLGERNTILSSRKSTSKLKVSDKPIKSEFAVSKIPVFKIKGSKTPNVQCENTPPRKLESKKVGRVSKSKWDTDETLVI